MHQATPTTVGGPHKGDSCRRTYSRPKPKLMGSPENALLAQVAALLRQQWSPEQIAAHRSKPHSQEAALRVSHETIHNAISAQPRSELKRELMACLRLARAKRWCRSRGKTGEARLPSS